MLNEQKISQASAVLARGWPRRCDISLYPFVYMTDISACLRRQSTFRGATMHSVSPKKIKGEFTWENSHRREFHTGMTFLFRIALWLGHFISRYLKVHFILIKYTEDSKSKTLRMRYPFQSTGRPISHRCEISYRSEILAPVQQTGWTHAWVTRAWMTFCGGIM